MNLKDKLKDFPRYTILIWITEQIVEIIWNHNSITGRSIICTESSTKYLSSEQDKWEHLVLDRNLGYGVTAVVDSVPT